MAVTLDEAADVLSISRTTAWRIFQLGLLTGGKSPEDGKIYIDERSIVGYVAENPEMYSDGYFASVCKDYHICDATCNQLTMG